jgi:hypothetical protein
LLRAIGTTTPVTEKATETQDNNNRIQVESFKNTEIAKEINITPLWGKIEHQRRNW